MKIKHIAFHPRIIRSIFVGLIILVILAGAGIGGYYYVLSQREIATTKQKQQTTQKKLDKVEATYSATLNALHTLQNVDQVKRNDELQATVKNIESTYQGTVTTYEQLLNLKTQTTDTKDFDSAYASILTFLAKQNYTSASAALTALKNNIAKKQAEIASSFQIPANVPTQNTAPTSGSSSQKVETDIGTFLVNVIAADLNSTRVVVDTASDSTCTDNCPVMALGQYAARSGAFAAINGPYFCPDSYPSCSGKKNSFDTLLMNKNHVYFNSDNNVYSTVPAVIFSGSSARYVGASQEWGRDTGVDAVIANQPLLVSNGNIVFGGDDEAKRASKGTRAFIGSSGSTVYIGVVYNANTVDMAHVIHTMGIQNALNLDSGGSIALWSNGRYLAGPGRALPFGILLIRK